MTGICNLCEGDAAAAAELEMPPEKQGSAASGLANSQLATQQGGFDGAKISALNK